MAKDFVISDGISYEEALNKGLEKIELSPEQVNVKIIEEKKAGLFRKGYVKLKIINKEEITEKIIDEIVDTQDKYNALIDEGDFFQINYQPAGIYLTVTRASNLEFDKKVELITDHLDKKEVENYELDAIHECLRGDINTPIIIAPYQEEILIEPEIIIETSRDKMEAYITIIEGERGVAPTLEMIEEKLSEKGIIFGVDKDKIDQMLKSKTFGIKLLIANGKKAQNGRDGKVIHHFDTHKDFKPQYLEDGSVDFKNLNLINNVEKGQLLAEIIPPTEGVEGKNIFGEKISALDGKEVKISRGKNIIKDDEGLRFLSEVDGQVLIKDGKLHVSKIYEIPGDVDNSIGNIDFNGNVVVRGNVKSGFTVKANGDIEVNGVVEAATLLAKGNIVLNRGIQGNNNAYLQCDGDLVSRYIENTTIKSGGSVEAGCILHSNITAKKNVEVKGRRGLIVGGLVRATEEIVANTIGSHMGTITNIEVGIDPDEKQRHEELKVDISEMSKNIKNLEKTIQLLNRMGKSRGLDDKKRDILSRSIKTYDILKEKYSKLMDQSKLIESKLQDSRGGKIHVSGTIYPGVKITILNAVRIIYDEFNNSTLFRKEGEVSIGPYEK